MTKRDNIDLLTKLLTCHTCDPQNASYLIPFQDDEAEWLAKAMADASYSAVAEQFGDDITQEEADLVWEQCLIDARRMLCDRDYARIFAITR
jgi:hypothetical protein